LQYYAPRCGVLIEREVWPNLLAAARARRMPVALVSARFSASSLRQAAWMGGVMREALGGLTAVLAQSAEDAQRLRQAGSREVSVSGNLKFDLELPPTQLAEGRAWRVQAGRPVVLIASTREGEDAGFVQAIQAASATPDAPLYVLVPRHPQRFEEAAQCLRAAGLAYLRRSAGGPAPGAEIQVLLGDTLGEMAFYYAAADVAIVAGSFAPLGGQNLIEACAAGTPVIVGPHTFNFKQAAADAIAAGAALRVETARQALEQAWLLLADAPRRQAMGEAGQTWTTAHRGAAIRSLAALAAWLGPGRRP